MNDKHQTEAQKRHFLQRKREKERKEESGYFDRKRIIELLEHQNALIESFAQAFFAVQSQQEDVLAKLLGEGGPDPVEESLATAERIRTGILRGQEDDAQELQDDEGQGT